MSCLRQIDELIAKGAPEVAVYDAIQAAIADYGGRLQQIWNDIEPEDYGIMLAVMELTAAAGIRPCLSRTTLMLTDEIKRQTKSVTIKVPDTGGLR